MLTFEDQILIGIRSVCFIDAYFWLTCFGIPRKKAFHLTKFCPLFVCYEQILLYLLFYEVCMNSSLVMRQV